MTSAADERSGEASVADALPGARPSAFYRLENTVQPYDWGSTSAIQDLLGVEPDGRPAAELWMGAHPLAPSRVLPDGAARPGEDPRPGGGAASGTLADLVRADPVGVLGQRVLDQYGPRLPYLLKVLAADRALSLQVHPRPHLARAGFNRENREGVARDSPLRSFHDDQHKPEMVVAVSRFEGLSGFRRPTRILELLGGLDGDLVARMRSALVARPTEAGVREAFTLALHARSAPDVAADLARTVASVRARAETPPGSGAVAASGAPRRTSRRADATVLALAEQHPGDPGAVVSLMLNRVTLAPGESMFVPSGHVHAYLSGCAVEIMASSDNVLRAGLTSKLVDVDALLECATCAPGPAARPRLVDDGSGLVTYRPPVAEFALRVGTVSGSVPVSLPDAGPRVVLCLDGGVTLAGGDGAAAAETVLARGASVFVPHATGPVVARGDGRVVIAYVP
ncbi:mannose-6-phosphate isomerase, class I [Cellulosimicrobium protaetiae]|uniref:mannose-6-phosphate isomerase n=1 Tax=Cellulosimicrobium protaetiae TaxID=2587808 RepID=A0A6M5UCT9_9MICO|nr:mannose-6-phosphate isomerase, class I [Cellulosimicrobium protaetiae]QJW35884.1 mannose-6-phosphate isomerase, class I [Cellulosimicrobium protaetiae]